MTKREKLIISEDNIYLKDKPEQFVMMSWETELMRAHSKKVSSIGGDILEIGFGMGIFSRFIHNHPINSHTIVESHPQIYESLLNWSKNYDNINIIFGDWYKLHWKINLKKYDGIFYDADCENNYLFRKMVVDESIKKGGVFSYFSPKGHDIYGYGDRLKREEIEIKEVIPNNVYHNSNKCFVNWVEY